MRKTGQGCAVAMEPEIEAALRKPDNRVLLERQARLESNARSYPRRLPIAVESASGVFLTDADGRQYFDCLSGAGVFALGHQHPVVMDAIRGALESGLPFQTLDLTTPAKDAFIREILESLPAAFAQTAKIQFCGPSGADAVEAAIKLVKTATGGRTLLCFHGAYHGMTHGALSLTGETAPKQAIAGLMADVHFLPYPYSFRCPFGLGGEAGQRVGAQYIENLLDDPNSGISRPAGMIVEVVQGEGGVIPAPDGWLREIRRITRERGIPLIIDEVQTGVGRTGRMYAFEHAEIIPDVVILSKAIGGGLPAGVVLYHGDLDQWRPGAHAGTFRGNQLAFAAGAATIRYIRERNLFEHAGRMGERLMASLRQVATRSPCIGEVRGRGLMIGVEIVGGGEAEDGGRRSAAEPALARRIQDEALRRGLVFELGGRRGSVVRFLPPLIVTPEHIDEIAARFAEAVVAAGPAS